MNRKHTWRKTLFAITVLALIGLVYFFCPRRAHLRQFDPATVGRLETAMWRDYYEHRYFALFRALYSVSREAYSFSPWNSVCIALHAARAAKVFQPTTNRAEAERAVPILERYYGVLRHRGGETFDVSKAAKLELDWWQLRREKATPDQYGQVIARVASEVYGVTNADIKAGSLLRAQMMDYRDERSDGRMQSEDWRHIEENLTRSYQLLWCGAKQSAAPGLKPGK